LSERDVQYGHFDPSFQPGEGKAGQSEPVTTEGQGQQQAMDQQ
jgi:hypothetical protein